MSARASGPSVDVDPERGGSDGFAAASSMSTGAASAAGSKDSSVDSSGIESAAGGPAANAAPADDSRATDATAAAAGGTTGSTSKWQRCSGFNVDVFTAPVLWVAGQFQAILAWIWLQCEPQRAWICSKAKPALGFLAYNRSYQAVFEDQLFFTGASDRADPRGFLMDLWSAYAVVVSQLGGDCLWPGRPTPAQAPHAGCQAHS